jgi:Kef-type K+ transport system membrane component KefB
MAGNTSGIIGGMNPLEYSASSPYTIFFFQLIVIITISQILYVPLSKIKQPRVIAEVLTGIILSHTVLGRIPNFTKFVFPAQSIPGLVLVANIGICLLMFIVGCEVDVKFIKKHIITALSVGIFNMALPFGLGCLCAIGLWKDYREGVEGLPEIKFTTFMVFIAVAMCITAFPVLVRILTELRLVKDRVGTVVLAAGITNDLIGWILLALSITLANSSESLITLYIVLVAIGWCLFICYPVRIVLHWFLRKVLKEFDNPNTPSRLATTILLLMTFASAFFTDIIGVHPIFGAFIMGTIVPRDNNYVIDLTSRIEDLVNIIFIPVYFAVAGLNVDLGLLNRGLDWGWAFGLIGIALVGKIIGGLVAAKLRGLYWRESLTVGVLMSCKGIVEIVVLQVGLNAHIISQKTYSMFIFMALITTFLTTPLTLYCYPKSYREKVQSWIAEKQKLGKDDASIISKESHKDMKNDEISIEKIILTVDDVESLSTGLLIMDMLLENAKVPVHAINLKTLTERTADVLHASMMNEEAPDHKFNSLNSILSIFNIFCHYNNIPFTSEILYSLPETYLQTVFDNPTFLPNDLFVLTITQRQFSIEYLQQIIKQGKDMDYQKAIFINNIQETKDYECKEINIEKNNDENNAEELDKFDNQSYFSDSTILNPSALKISSVTLYINNVELTRIDKFSMKLFDVLIKNKDLTNGKVMLNNIEPTSKTHDEIATWIAGNQDMFKNISFSIINKTNELKNVESGKSVGAYLTSAEASCTKLDRLIIVSITDHENIEYISELVKNHDKVIVLF